MPGDRRLFLTATPRVHTVATKASDKGGETLLMSMDDENAYGPQVYTLSVAEAVERGILSQYQVAVIGVSDAELSSAAQVLDTIMVDGHELNTDHVASTVALSKAARGIGLHSVIAYFNSRATSKAFVEAFRIVHASRSMLLSGGTAEHIDGNMKLTDRAAALSRLATVHDGGFHLVSNARCLTEGIDVPVLDGVLFGEPRSSQIDVVQCVGRAIRKNPRTDNPALIVLAVRTGDGQDVETAIAEAGFTKVRQVIAALSDHDPRIAEAARTLARDRGDSDGGDRPTGDELDTARQLISLNIPEALLHSGFGLRMLLSQDERAWEQRFAELLEYVEAAGDARAPEGHVTPAGFNLGAWAGKQRWVYRSGKLPADRAARLEALPGWSWDPVADQWEQGFAAAVSYAANHGHACVPRTCITANGFNLGEWVGGQRRVYRTGKLSASRTARLEALPGWVWDAITDQWEQGFSAAESYVIEHGNACVPIGHVTANGFKLGRWVSLQRGACRAGKLSADRVARLAALPGWLWDPLDDRWEKGCAAVIAYATEHGHAQVPGRHVTAEGFNLGCWVGSQRVACRSGNLSAERVARLEALPGWVWDQFTAQWEQGFVAASAYAQDYRNARIPDHHLTAGGFNLGQWASVQRRSYRGGNLTADRIARLEALPGWSWDQLTDKWEQGFAAVRAYILEHGSGRVPENHVTAEGFKLGTWSNRQRKSFRTGKLGADRATRLEALPGWSWDQLDEQWEQGFAAVRRYIAGHGDARVPNRAAAEGFKLGMWSNRQRRLFRAGKLGADRATRLEALPGWSWDPLGEQWEQGFTAVRAYIAEHGSARVPRGFASGDGFRLGGWVHMQRSGYHADKLSADRIARLEALPGWVWDARS